MKYFAILLRLLIILIWIKILIISKANFWTVDFCTWVGFIVVWLYLSLQALFWPRALICPFIQLNCPMDNKNK